MEMMEFRYNELGEALKGLEETQLSLVGSKDGALSAAGFTDDLGLYYFVPKIAHALGVSLDCAIDIFFGSILGVGIVVSIVCFFFLFRSFVIRALVTVGISLIALMLMGKFRDVYSIACIGSMVVIPPIIAYSHRRSQSNFLLGCLLSFVGVVLGYSNLIRCFSGTGLVLFALLWIALHEKLRPREKILHTAILTVFFAVPYLHFNNLETKRNEFLYHSNLKQVSPVAGDYYNPILLEARSQHQPKKITHPIWHSAYIGLGFIANDYGIEYSDTCALNAALKVKPDVVYCSEEYEQILKGCYFTILKTNPFFALKSMMYKILIIFKKLLMVLNIGLPLIFYLKLRVRIIIPFIAAIVFYSMPGVLVLPENRYILGMLATGALLGIYLTGLGMEKFLMSFRKKQEV